MFVPRQTVPKNTFDLLNDKSKVEGLRDMYHRFGTIDTTGSMYDDEYDDTYDDDLAIEEAGEAEQRYNFQESMVFVFEKIISK